MYPVWIPTIPIVPSYIISQKTHALSSLHVSTEFHSNYHPPLHHVRPFTPGLSFYRQQEISPFDLNLEQLTEDMLRQKFFVNHLRFKL